MRAAFSHRTLVTLRIFLVLAITHDSKVLNGQQQRQQVMLKVEVIDSMGALIPGAHINLRADKSGGFGKTNEDQTAITDKKGSQTLSISPGFYDLCVMADAFTPQCRKLIVEHSRLPNKNFVYQSTQRQHAVSPTLSTNSSYESTQER